MNPTVKIEVTAKSAYDKFAKEQSLENLAKSDLFLPQNAQMLEDYVECLDDDSNMPKATLLKLIKKRKERQARIAQTKVKRDLPNPAFERPIRTSIGAPKRIPKLLPRTKLLAAGVS